jgi:hypothetical protein
MVKILMFYGYKNNTCLTRKDLPRTPDTLAHCRKDELLYANIVLCHGLILFKVISRLIFIFGANNVPFKFVFKRIVFTLSAPPRQLTGAIVTVGVYIHISPSLSPLPLCGVFNYFFLLTLLALHSFEQ